ncbi:hypothetical protein ABZZ74_43495 [Streptomyces sp. NPDC006476]|uniref:hypothetical protein n=1 Tax=Streptomyces sp. NPDC006476 TaxID=3157175 RepID=UPI0033AC6613
MSECPVNARRPVRFTDLDGNRPTCFATDRKGGQLVDLTLRQLVALVANGHSLRGGDAGRARWVYPRMRLLLLLAESADGYVLRGTASIRPTLGLCLNC